MAKKDSKQTNSENKEKQESVKKESLNTEAILKEVADLKLERQQLLSEIAALKKQIADANLVYINKIKEKSEELQKILNEKQQELILLNENKLIEAKTKLYTKDISDLIDTIEQFDKIINIPNDNPQIQNFLFGFKMFSNMFSNALSSMSIEKINIQLGSEPNYELVEVIETTSNKNYKSGTISEIVTNGYKYKDKVIKFAKVKVEQ